MAYMQACGRIKVEGFWVSNKKSIGWAHCFVAAFNLKRAQNPHVLCVHSGFALRAPCTASHPINFGDGEDLRNKSTSLFERRLESSPATIFC